MPDNADVNLLEARTEHVKPKRVELIYLVTIK